MLGNKTQHYIPVLLNHHEKRSETENDYGRMEHEMMEDYNYLIPILDPENENHRQLLNILNSKDSDGSFVYTVDDKRCNIVFGGQLEHAIRDGDVIDVLVSQRNDKILIKLKNFKKVPLEMNQLDPEEEILLSGEGSTSPEEERFHHHGKFTMSIAKIFEDKEREAEEWELELKRIIEKRIKKAGEGTKEWNDLISINLNQLDWRKYEKDCKRVVDQLAEPIVEQHIGMEVTNLDLTKDVAQVVNIAEVLHQLPTMGEIPDVVNSMSNATPHEIEAEIEKESFPKSKRRVSGVKVTLPSGKECFVTGQMVKTDNGDVFVPGQTVENEFGCEYAPGITVNMDNQPTLINGLIVGEEDNQRAMFCPTDTTITSEGQLSFTTTKEERIKYKPRKPRKPKLKIKKEKENLEEIQEILTPKEEKIEEKPKKKRLKKKTTPTTPKKEELETIIMAIPDDLGLTFEEVQIEAKPQPKLEPEPEETRDDSSLEQDQRQELEQLRKELLDDGLDEIVASLEEKRTSLKQKLEELRKIKVSYSNDSVTYINNQDAEQIASTITSQNSRKLSEILITLTRRAATFRDRRAIDPENVHNPSIICSTTHVTESDSRFQECESKLKMVLKKAMVEANEVFKSRPKDQLLALKTIGEVLEGLKESSVEELCNLMNTSLERNEICTSIFKELTQNITENKLEMLKAIKNETDGDLAVEKIVGIINKEGSVMVGAFKKISKAYEGVLEKIQETIKRKVNRIKTEKGAIELLQNAIVASVKESSEEMLNDFVKDADENSKRDFIAEAIGLSTALGRNEIVENLSGLSLDPELKIKACSKVSMELLKRLLVIRKLAERDYSLKTALERIKKNPDCGKTDPRIRQLVRESAVLISDASPLQNSKDLPLTFLKNQNFLAIEDFLVQRSSSNYPILICKKGLQAVIPKESARSVLAGRVPYVLIDESGIGTFKPMHTLSALKSNKNRERFEDYSCITGRETSPRFTPRQSSPKASEVRDRIRKSLNRSRMLA